MAQRSEHYENRQESDTAAMVANITAEWRIGEVILDTYVVKQVHEGGGMGLVYRVHHRDWNMDLAVKSPRAKYFQTEQQKQNFARECETWINLGLHPHIVSCFYVRTLGDIPRVFAEYVEGGSLNDWIRCRRLYEGGPRAALKRILDIAIQMAWGLHYAHEQGLIHQDMKPGNVMITPEGTAKITDFGLAKARASTAEAELTDQNRSILVTTGGMTPAYCSPEQASQQSLTRRTDIWSWGVSVLEMFVSDVVWRSGSAAPHVLEQLGELHLNEAVVPKMPDSMKRLLRQCFDVNPDKRPPTFSPVTEHLKQLYCEVLGEEFERAHPKAADLLADGLNNRAVSLLDLGKLGESEKILEQALLAHPGHPQATYNLGLIQWRTARKTDTDLLATLRQVQQRHPHDPAALYFLGVVHLERGDAEGAILALREAKKIGGGADVDVALIEAVRIRDDAPRCVTVLETRKTGWSYFSTDVVAWSADARFALTMSAAWALCLWDIRGGVCLHEFRAGGSCRRSDSLSVSADFRLALTSDSDRTVRLWDISNGACIKSFNTDLKGVGRAAMSADGRRALLGGSEDNRLKLLDLTTGKLLMILDHELIGRWEGVREILLTRDGGMGFVAVNDDKLRLWDLNTGQCVQKLDNWGGRYMAVSSDGRHLLSVGGKLRLWSIEHDSCVATLNVHTHTFGRPVAMAADGSWAISASGYKTLHLWDLGTGRCLRTLEEDVASTSSVLNEDGRYVLSSDGGGTVRLWDFGPHPGIVGKIAAPLAICRVSGVAEVERRKSTFDRLMRSAKAAFAEGQYARCSALVLEARSVPGYELARDAIEWSNTVGRHGIRKRCRGSWCRGELEKLGGENLGGLKSVAMSLDGRLAVTGHSGYYIGIWDVPAQRLLKMVGTSRGEVKSVALSTDGRWAVSCYSEIDFGTHMGADGQWISDTPKNRLRLWEVPAGRCVRTLEAHNAEPIDMNSLYETVPIAVATSADGRLAISACDDKTIRLWDLSKGNCLDTWEGTRSNLMALSADGRCALLCDEQDCERGIMSWPLPFNGAPTHFPVPFNGAPLEGETGWVTSISLTYDGRYALSGNSDGTLRLWDVEDGHCTRVLEGHTSDVTSVAFSSDGRFALSGSQDLTLRLWELNTGNSIQILEISPVAAISVALSGDCRWALAACSDGALRLWELDWEHEFPESQDWDEGAKPYLDIFLTLHCPLDESGLSRRGKPTWDEDEFQQLIDQMHYWGYGWLRHEGVRRKLEKMAEGWQEPPPQPGISRAIEEVKKRFTIINQC